MADIDKKFKIKLKILMHCDFSKLFFKSEHPDVEAFINNLMVYRHEIGFTQDEAELIKKVSLEISKVPAQIRYDKLLIYLSSEIASFSIGKRIFHIEPLSKITLEEAVTLVHGRVLT